MGSPTIHHRTASRTFLTYFQFSDMAGLTFEVLQNLQPYILSYATFRNGGTDKICFWAKKLKIQIPSLRKESQQVQV